MRPTVTDILTTVETSLVANFNHIYRWFEKDAALMQYRPVNGGWSINEILEHVSLTNHFLLLIINKTTAKAVKRASDTSDIEVPHNYMIRLQQVDEVGRHKSFTWIRPEHMEPVGKPIANVLAILNQQLEQCLRNLHLLDNGKGLLVNTTMTVNNLGKIDVYQYLYFLSKHIERHIAQMELIEKEFKQD